MNEDIFKNVLKNHLKLESKDYKFTSIENKPITKPGDNYMSLMIRSVVNIEMNDGRKESSSYITKALIHNDFTQPIIEGCGVYPKEQMMYTKFIPEFEKLYFDAGVDVQLSPKCFYTTNSPTAMIVMEDLSHYEMADRFLNLDRTHTERGLEQLAKLHAASMVYKDLNGDFSEEFKLGVYSMKIESTYHPFMESFLDHYVEALKKLPDGDKYAAKAEKWRGHLFSKTCELLAFDENAFNVLNHGDIWSNNVLFLYDKDRKLKDLKLVDYQLTFWGTVASDIYYFMVSSWNVDIKIKKFDDLIKFYFEQLIGNLTTLKYKKSFPTFEQLEKELLRRCFFGKIENSIYC